MPREYAWTEHPPSEIIVAEVELPRVNCTKRTGIGRFSSNQRSSRLVAKKRFIHPGEVNRVRAFASPYEHVIVSKTDSPCVFLWDTRRQPDRSDLLNKPPSGSEKWVKSVKQEDVRSVDAKDLAKIQADLVAGRRAGRVFYEASMPDVALTGHKSKAEYALSCCSETMSVLSGGSDAQVLVWDVKGYESQGAQMDPVLRFKGHQANVEDCAFHPTEPNLCCSVGDDKKLMLWDRRHGSDAVVKASNVHADDINCCAYNQVMPQYILTGGSDAKIKLLDVRKLSGNTDVSRRKDSVLATLDQGDSSVLNIKWSPNDAHHFASTNESHLLALWKVDNLGDETQTPEAAMQVSPEMMFKHAGHRGPVVDFDWSVDEERWLFTTVSDATDYGAGTLQVWRISDFITQQDKPEFVSLLDKIRGAS